MSLFEQPGNLGPIRGTLLTVHHADWPTYSEGDDFRSPLLQLTAFPVGTDFIVVDDIDASLLLIADVKSAPVSRPFDPSNFHVAVWHQDLVELDKRGLVTGAKPASNREWSNSRWEELKSKVPPGQLAIQNHDGTFQYLEKPSVEEDEEDLCWQPFVICEGHRFQLTPNGRRFLIGELQQQAPDFASSISSKVQHLFELGYFDTCIREACVNLSTKSGWKLPLMNGGIDLLRSSSRPCDPSGCSLRARFAHSAKSSALPSNLCETNTCTI